MNDTNKEEPDSVIEEMRSAGYPFQWSKEQLDGWLDRLEDAICRERKWYTRNFYLFRKNREAEDRVCDILPKQRLIDTIIYAIENKVPGFESVSELEKSLARAVVEATVEMAYSTDIAKQMKEKAE